MKINWKTLLLILCLFAANQLYAYNYSFRCENQNISKLAQGTYTVNDDKQLIYTHHDGQEIDIFSSFKPYLNNNTISDLYIETHMKDYYGNDYYEFDEKGNLYFLGMSNYVTKQISGNSYEETPHYYSVILLKFNPVTHAVSYKIIKELAYPHSMCISKDGKNIFIDLIENFNFIKWEGTPAVYAIDGDFASEPVSIYKSNHIEKYEDRSIVNLCFDETSRTLYFSSKNTINNKIVSGLGGLFQLKPNKYGKYIEDNVTQDSSYEKSAFRLFANQNGLWGLTGDSSRYCRLVHIFTASGETIEEQEKILDKILISGTYLYNPVFVQNNNCIFYLNSEDNNFYCFDNGKIKKITKLAPKKADLNYSTLLQISEIYNKNKQKSNNVISANLNKVYISVIALLLVVIIVLILIIGHFTNKSNQIKKDKKFIFSIQEAERGKISRDIHDSIIQDIRAIRIETDLLKTDSENQIHKDNVIRIATDCVVKLRNICYNLTPAELSTHEEGDSSKIELVSIIQTLVLQFIERTHVPCQLKIDKNFEYPVLDKETSQNLFRIIQEALTNIEKHSYATNCQILIKNKIIDEKKYMLIYVSDDGVGCDLKNLRKHNRKLHFGLKNIVERAKLIGATVEFQSEPGQGFEVKIKL